MTGLLVTADTHGNVVVQVTITTPDGFTCVEPAGGGRLVLELGADEPVQVRITAPDRVLLEVLRAALAAALTHVDGAAL